MYLVSAQKGHWLGQLCIISPIFKMKWLTKTAFCFSEFRCVWRKPSDAGGRSQGGGMKVGSWIHRPHDLSPKTWGALTPRCISPSEYTPGRVRGWVCSAHTLNKGQQSTKEACRPLLGVQREPHDGQQCRADRGLEDLCGFRGRSVHVYKCCVVAAVQSLSRVRLSVTPWTAACQASLSITNSRSPLKFMFIESVMPSNHLIICHPLLLPPSIFPLIRVFSS